MRRMASARTYSAVLCLTVLAIAAIAACDLAAAAPASGLITVPLPESDAAIYIDANGIAAFTGTDIQQIGQTGEPSLPCQYVRVLLPPDADLSTVKAMVTGCQWTGIDGEWDIPPVRPLVTGDGGGTGASSPADKAIGDGRNAGIYESDALFPLEPVLKVDIQVIRGWNIAQVFYAPIAYNPVEKKVFRLSGSAIEITFETASLKSTSGGIDLAIADEVREMTANFSAISEEYDGYAVSADTGRYVIITTSTIAAASANLDDFVASKEARGFTVQVVTEGTWGGGTGDHAAEHIRSWLQDNYLDLDVKYVLLIGNPNPTTGDVPMKMCYPQASEAGYPDCPTDFYYAELTSDWDTESGGTGDGRYGEYWDDFSGNPPRVAEVSVGRIPYYGSTTDLDHILAKITAYEAEPETDISWHRNVLLPMKPSDVSTPGYQLGEEIKDEFLVPNGLTYHRIYDQYNSYCTPDPCFLSIPVDTETVPCTITNVTNTWNGSYFGAVFWWTHGSETSATGVMNVTNAATLDDAHPSFTFQGACLNGSPETTNNLGYSLLKNGCVATVSASRVSWYRPGQTSFAGTPTNSGMAFEYADRLVGEEMYAGDALNGLKADVFPYDEVLWMNYLDFNLYGCPAVGLYTAPLVETDDATNVLTTSARLNGSVSSLGTLETVSVSFQWGTESGVYGNETAAEVKTSTGTFYFNLIGITPGTTYYYRAKAAGWGTGYGAEESFTTPAEPPSVTTNAVSDRGTTWAILSGDLEDLGTAENATVSFEWGLTPAYGNDTTPQPGAQVGLFSDNLTDLAPKTTYHFRAKAVGHGTAYGVDRTFTTLTISPSVTTNDASSMTTTSAWLNGNLSSMGTASSVTLSFVWGTTSGSYPYETTSQVVTGTGPFGTNLWILTPGSTYYCRAKAVGDGTVYGLEKSFTTLTAPPLVNTGYATGITVEGARLNGSLSSLGTAVIVSVSFEWGTTSGDYTSETTPAELKDATGDFYVDLSGLASATTFYYRAKAVGHEDAAYGLEESFRTGIPPAVTTLDASGLTFTEARLNGDLTTLGEADNVTVSFVWGTTPNCSNDTAGEVKTDSGAFDFRLDRLDPGTTYYYKAKANGSAGPVFGDQMIFTTLAQPTVTNDAATDLTTTAARLNGNLTSLGSATNVTISFQWGTTSGGYNYETIPETKDLTGAFYFDLTGLYPGTTYYYRAKVVGDGEPVYGAERSFATSVTPPAVTTSDATKVTTASALLNANLVSLGTRSSVVVSFLWKVAGGTYAETAVQAKIATGPVSADLGSLAQGTTYYYKVKAVGDGGPVYGDEVSFTTADGAAPLISMAGASGITASGATITWTTNEPATSQVEYGLTEEYGSLTPMGADLVKSHSIHLPHLKAGKVYHYRVVSRDAADNQAVSADGTFSTAARSGEIPVWAWILVGLGVIAGIAILLALLRADRLKRQNRAAA